MAARIRIIDEGDPISNVPVVLLFDGVIRRDAITDNSGEIIVDPCPWSSVHVTINGMDHGFHFCGDGLDVEIDRSE
jgi:hypothetical protein